MLGGPQLSGASWHPSRSAPKRSGCFSFPGRSAAPWQDLRYSVVPWSDVPHATCWQLSCDTDPSSGLQGRWQHVGCREPATVPGPGTAFVSGNSARMGTDRSTRPEYSGESLDPMWGWRVLLRSARLAGL